MRRKVLYLVKAGEEFYELIRSVMPLDRYELLTLEDGTEKERHSLLSEVEMVIVGGIRMSEEDVEAAKKLRLVLHQGVGYHDTVATGLLMERQIRLALTPQGTSEGVAEHTIMMMLAVGRRLTFCDSELRKGIWHSNTFRSSARQLMGSTVGIIGLGRIGRQVAQRLIGFNTKTLYTDLLEIPREIERELHVTRTTLDGLLSESDFVTLHVPLTKLTHHLIDAAALAKMKPEVTLINCARGPVVSEKALLRALIAGQIGGVGLDVFETEPPVAPSPFAEFPNVVLTPHHAPGTRDTMIVKFREIFLNADRFFSGERMENEVSLS
ncbi:MAG: 3-phosphoglycerate dehydrogenase [Rhodospirillaceae bacterium]|nr:3-phosphoglycerate dehydrogenase [Rhodospirillaceae bacterium]